MSLWHALVAREDHCLAFISDASKTVQFAELIRGSVLGGRAEDLRRRSVLVAMENHFLAALALVELDGIARRLVLCPHDLQVSHLSFIKEAAGVEAIVSDRTTDGEPFLECSTRIVPANYNRDSPLQTEWILLTSGTTGRPKLVLHTLASLTGAIETDRSKAGIAVWSTFYDILRYGGLQIFLRALLGGASLVLSDAQESTADFLARAGRSGVSHISGTPSHWRRALMSPSAGLIAPSYIRLSGEIADQAMLNNLKSFYPEAEVAHAFASTEAGVAFAVNDGYAGFPAHFVNHTVGVEMKVQDGSLCIRSSRTACRYLGDEKRLREDDGFVDTGDVVELRDNRYHFAGRRDGVINVGGLKVHPEEVEAVINRHPGVRMSLVHTRKNPITGALVVAHVVLNEPCVDGGRDLQAEIVKICRDCLPAHKVPSSIKFVHALAVAETGKLMRSDA